MASLRGACYSGRAMPLLFVVKRSRPALFRALKRLLERPGVAAVVLERRRAGRRPLPQPAAPDDRRWLTVRQPLDGDSWRSWTALGFFVVKVHTLPDIASTGRDGAARRPRSRSRPAARRTR